MTPTRTRKSGSRRRRDALDDALSYLGRCYFNYVGLLERVLHDLQLDQHLAPGMGQIMLTLFEQDDRIIKEIAERVSLSQSTLTGILTKMEQAGLIERRRDDHDGRATRVKLTNLGRSLEARCWEVVDRVYSHIHRGISDSELDSLKSAMVKLNAALKEE